jgi:hypothetical protein
LITIREDLDAITTILYQVFEISSFKRDYDAVFGKIADILSRYGIIENHIIFVCDGCPNEIGHSCYHCGNFLWIYGMKKWITKQIIITNTKSTTF